MDRFGRYEIIAELGRGGMAQVFHARDPEFDREVAVKVLPREFLHDPKFRTRFQREARALAALQHKAIVPVYDIGEEEGQPFLVMAYMAGGSLDERLEDGPLSLAETAEIIAQIAPALDYAHRRGMIHRDIKPANILFDAFGDAYLSDFGIVRLSEATAQLTGAGLLGTPAYMAPELADDFEPTALIDIYALGVTVFRMLSGRLPYEAPTPVGLMTAHVTKPIPDIREANPLLPPGVQQVIDTALAKDPAERYVTASQLSAALADLLTVRGGLVDDAATIAAATVVREIATYIESPAAAPKDPATPDTLLLAPSGPSGEPPSGRAGGDWRRVGAGVLALAGILVAVGCVVAVLAVSGVLGQWLGGSAAQEEHSQLLIPTDEPTPTATPEPTATPTVTPSPTPLGGGRGHIVFASDRDGNREIYVMDADGSNPIRLTDHEAWDDYPAWSPDGSQIAFDSDRSDSTEVYVMDADGSNLTRLTDDETSNRDPVWSPDGSQIAFVSFRDGNYEIYVMDADGSNLTRLTNDEAADVFPAWSPDGGRIAFYSDRDGDREIYVIDADGSNLTNLTNHDADDLIPAWSPDGSQIAFVSDRGGNREIYVMDADGSNLMRLTNDDAEDRDPVWSPDGSQIAFASDRDDNWEIYVVSTDGSNLINLTNDEAADVRPAWQP